MNSTVKLTLSNFANSHDFIKMTNKLNHIVDTKRVYKLVDINDDEIKFYSLTDPNHTVSSKPRNKVFVFNGSIIRDITPLSKRYLIDNPVFYVINVEDGNPDSMVISGDGFVAPENNPRTSKDIEAQYDTDFAEINGQYNYVSLENIIPITHKFNDAHHLDDVGYNLLVGAGNAKSYDNILCKYWGVEADPKFYSHYNFAKKAISFNVQPMDGVYRDDQTMLDYLKLFNGTDIQISALDDFIQATGLNTVEYPRILDVMAELHTQTGIDFAVCIEKTNE